MYELIDLPGLGEKTAERLAEVNVHSVDDLRNAGADAAGRSHIAREAPLDEGDVRRWVRIADLLRVEAMTPILAALLVQVEVTTVTRLASVEAENLIPKLVSATGDDDEKQEAIPSADALETMHQQAAELPVVIEMPEDAGLDPDHLLDSFSAANLVERDGLNTLLTDISTTFQDEAMEAIASTGLVDEETAPVPALPRDIDQYTPEELQQAFDKLPDLQLPNTPSDFLSNVDPQQILARSRQSRPGRQPGSTLTPESLAQLAIGSELQTLAARRRLQIDAVNPTDLRRASLQQPDHLERVRQTYEFLAGKHRQALERLKEALAEGEKDAIEESAFGAQALVPVIAEDAGWIHALLDQIGSAVGNFDVAQWHTRTAWLARHARIHAIFAAQVSGRVAGGETLDDLQEAAQRYPLVEEEFREIGVAEFLTTNQRRIPLQLLGRLLPPETEPQDGHYTIDLQDFADHEQQITVTLPGPVISSKHIIKPVALSILVQTQRNNSGYVRAVPRRQERKPRNWQLFVARIVADLLSDGPDGIYATLYPQLPETDIIYRRMLQMIGRE